MRSEIYLKEGIKEMINESSIKNYGLITAYDYNKFSITMDQEINDRIATNVENLKEENYLLVDPKCVVTHKELINPARGINCKHLQCMELDNFIIFIMKRKYLIF